MTVILNKVSKRTLRFVVYIASDCFRAFFVCNKMPPTKGKIWILITWRRISGFKVYRDDVESGSGLDLNLNLEQGRRQGKSLGGGGPKEPLGSRGQRRRRGSRGQSRLVGVREQSPLKLKFFSAKIVIEAFQSTYFLVKDDRKANLNNDAWKYIIFFHFSPFLKSLGGLLPPLAPLWRRPWSGEIFPRSLS